MKAKDLAFTVVVIVLIALTALTPNSPTLVLTRDVLADANPAPLAAPVGTSFTYQGQLMEDGEPADGVYDFQFMLYDEETAGSAVGSPVEVEDVVVTGGVFSTELDFGASAFAGEARWLEIGVRPGGSAGAYTTLDPRQKVTSTPYALYAAKAPWSGLSGVPAGFADGVDNGSAYQNVKIVAKSGGDFTTITAALNSITDASDSNRYLVWVAPGVYTEAVTMKPYVDIEGAGELTTRITFIGSAANTGTVVGANNAELRFLTAENTGGNTYATAIFSNGAAPRLTHVTASASGGTIYTFGVYNYNSSSPTMTHVIASATGGATNNVGVNNSHSSATIANVIATASGGTNNYGVYNYTSSPTMTDVTASASGGTASYGMYNEGGSWPTTENVTAGAWGATSLNCGVYNLASGPRLTNITATASGGTYSYGVYNEGSSATISFGIINAESGTSNYGLYNSASGGLYTVLVNNSQITGSTNTVRNDSEFTTRIGASQLSGGAITGGGTVTCAGVYDENYAFSASTCP